MTAGRDVIFFKKSAGYEEDIYPTKYDEASSITVAPTTKTLSLGGTTTATLVATVLPLGANQAVVWASSAPSKATVSSAGLITGVAAGTSNVTATSVAVGSLVDTCVLTVTG